MKKSLAILMGCAALGLVAVGCGGDDNDDNGGGGGGSEATPQPKGGAEEQTGGATAGGKTVEVHMKDIAFDPNKISVAKGSTVDWINDDSVGHDVTKTGGPGPEFKSGSPGGLNQGDDFKHTFTTAGTIQYVCTVHPNMTGTVTVK